MSDPLDKEIVDHLTENARTSFRQIAKKTDKSTDTIINHFTSLMENGDIRGSTVVVDREKIGYEGIAAFEIDVSSNTDTSSDQILETLIKMPNIIVATKTVGEHDILVLAVIHDLKHYQEISVEISQINGVKNLASNIWSGNEKIMPKYFII
jgi:Lrp/AsnC family transcriptional regulator for asnA, asnC and gidA